MQMLKILMSSSMKVWITIKGSHQLRIHRRSSNILKTNNTTTTKIKAMITTIRIMTIISNNMGNTTRIRGMTKITIKTDKTTIIMIKTTNKIIIRISSMIIIRVMTSKIRTMISTIITKDTTSKIIINRIITTKTTIITTITRTNNTNKTTIKIRNMRMSSLNGKIRKKRMTRVHTKKIIITTTIIITMISLTRITMIKITTITTKIIKLMTIIIGTRNI